MKRKRLLAFVFCLVILFQIQPKIVKSAAPEVTMKKGQIVFTTKDTTATNSITWETAGFIVTREKCLTGSTANGGYPLNKDHGQFTLKPEWKNEDVQESITYVKFTIPEKVVNKALIDAGLDEIGENDIIYLHAIHKVKHNGRPYGSLKYDYPSIRNAEGWANPNDFRDRFDVPVRYKASGPQPVTETYMTADGKVILTRKLNKVNMGIKAEVRHEKTIEYQGKTLYLSKSYQNYLETNKRITGTTNFVTSVNAKDYEEQLGRVRLRKKMQAPGGLEFVAVMREKKKMDADQDNPDVGTDQEEMGEELLEPNPYGTIAADERYNERFDVQEGIPTTDDLYTNVFSYNFLLGYKFKRVSGTKTYPVNVSRTYNLSWTETGTDSEGKPTYNHRTASETRSQTIQVKREFSYWVLDNIDYYKIKQTDIRNYALPAGSVTMTPASSYKVPDLRFQHSEKEGDHIKEPSPPSSITLPRKSVGGGSSRPSVPSEDFSSYAEAKVGKIKARNDEMTFDGIKSMENGWKDEKTDEPKYVETAPEEIDENILFRSGMTIDRDKTNGSYSSSGTLTYERVPGSELNPNFEDNLTYPVSELTEVVIHTPTVCDVSISDMAKYNQMITPDKSVAGLVLDRPFSVSYPTSGEHRYIDGYGYRDYDRYIESRKIRFPFDVYRGSVFYKSDTWITIASELTEFYLPIWVDEGKYTIECRSAAINSAANGGGEKTETLANLNLSNYVATDTVNVEVSGRIYGLTLYDISDYPVWQNVFRQPDSLKRSGFNYTVGTKDQNGSATGRKEKYTLALINGSHPKYTNIGAIKSGYVTRFQLTTIGNMHKHEDYVRITPKFYYMDAEGKNRQEADVYYTETFEGKRQQLVKAGSDQDKQNKKAFRLGDPYLAVPPDEITDKARLEGKDVQETIGEKRNILTFTNIMIPETLRTYIGTNYTPTGTVPAAVDADKVTKSMQNWYCEYYLPSEIHAAPKGFDVYGYARDHYGVDYKEDFWLKDGYLVINFDIETIQDGSRHLSYINPGNSPQGYCNMWKMEGYQYEKEDFKENPLMFVDGDYVMYFTDKSAAKDYITGGTH